ncbi:hypothetical protein [Streptomyces sp. NPDC005438]|uniref:hypothetical protein n=1 Tax=Streptomyces sp. NPDC005438 TaxID=3156880 RepID=UPI0033B10B96
MTRFQTAVVMSVAFSMLGMAGCGQGEAKSSGRRTCEQALGEEAVEWAEKERGIDTYEARSDYWNVKDAVTGLKKTLASRELDPTKNMPFRANVCRMWPEGYSWRDTQLHWEEVQHDFGDAVKSEKREMEDYRVSSDGRAYPYRYRRLNPDVLAIFRPVAGGGFLYAVQVRCEVSGARSRQKEGAFRVTSTDLRSVKPDGSNNFRLVLSSTRKLVKSVNCLNGPDIPEKVPAAMRHPNPAR